MVSVSASLGRLNAAALACRNLAFAMRSRGRVIIYRSIAPASHFHRFIEAVAADCRINPGTSHH
jgi:hypothetical protein